MTVAVFADGAGAVILSPAGGAPDACLSYYLDAQGEQYEQIMIPAGGSRAPVTLEAIEAGAHWMRMSRGPDVYREAVRGMVRAGEGALERAGLTAAEVDWWVPHQANTRLIRDAGERLGIGADRTVCVVETLGNSSAATIPIALAIAVRDGRIRAGQRLLLTAVGAGMTAAGAVVRWAE
jgi:3-oxoacyl-[acyl-carrier-protein] synthase-3